MPFYKKLIQPERFDVAARALIDLGGFVRSGASGIVAIDVIILLLKIQIY